MMSVEEIAAEIADAVVNRNGYADDAAESDRRSEERDVVEQIVAATLRSEVETLHVLGILNEGG